MATKKDRQKKALAALLKASTDAAFAAVTNKATVLVRLGSPSIPLKKGALLTVFSEDPPFASVSTKVGGGGVEFGSVRIADYDKV